MKSSILFMAIAAALNAAASSFIDSARAAEVDGGNEDTITTEQISNAEFDSSGLPWDERIHAGTKGINADGTWKRRRNTSDDVFDAVTAELRALVAGSTPAAAVATPVAAAVPSIAAPQAPQAITVPSLPAATPVANDYTKLCDFLAKNTGEGTALDDTWMSAFFKVNATTLPELANDIPRAGRMLDGLRETLKANNIAEVV